MQLNKSIVLRYFIILQFLALSAFLFVIKNFLKTTQILTNKLSQRIFSNNTKMHLYSSEFNLEILIVELSLSTISNRQKIV